LGKCLPSRQAADFKRVKFCTILHEVGCSGGGEEVACANSESTRTPITNVPRHSSEYAFYSHVQLATVTVVCGSDKMHAILGD